MSAASHRERRGGTLCDLPTGGVWSPQARPDAPLLDSTRCSEPTLLHLQKPVFRHTLHQPQEQQEHRSLCFVLITAKREQGWGNLIPKAVRLPFSPPPLHQGEVREKAPESEAETRCCGGRIPPRRIRRNPSNYKS